MERISENDVDCFLQQMAQVFAPLPEMGKCREEWRHLPGFRIWLPGSFQLADRETAEEVFWSEALPEMLYMTEDGTAGITLQTMEDAEVTVQEVRQRLERLDERIVCYGSGTEEGRAGQGCAGWNTRALRRTAGYTTCCSSSGQAAATGLALFTALTRNMADGNRWYGRSCGR